MISNNSDDEEEEEQLEDGKRTFSLAVQALKASKIVFHFLRAIKLCFAAKHRCLYIYIFREGR